MNDVRPNVRRRTAARVSHFAVAALLLAGATAFAQSAPPELVPELPKPTVPEIFTLQGQYVRVAYNSEGYAILGYRTANGSKGQEWMMLDAGVTILRPTPDYDFKRESFSIKTPDGTIIPLATQTEYAEAGYLRALNERAKVSRDSLNYFPIDATKGCALQFFSDLGSSKNKLAYDEVTLTSDRACVGRLFFHIPGGIQVGQHWLLVKFANSTIEVPFRILTKDEEKKFKKTWQDLKKALDEGLLK